MIVGKNGLNKLIKNLKKSFSKVKNELDDHLDAINANTLEIKFVYEYLYGLEEKINKLSERLDELVVPASTLTLREQEVFLSMYASAKPLSHFEISSKLGLTIGAVDSLINSLRSKGIPIIEFSSDNIVFFQLENSFSEMQAKNKIVKIDPIVAKNFFSDDSIRVKNIS